MNYSHDNIAEHFTQYAEHFKFAIVAHTNLRACDKSQRQIDSMIEKTSSNCRYAMNCFSKLLYLHSAFSVSYIHLRIRLMSKLYSGNVSAGRVIVFSALNLYVGNGLLPR